MSKNQNRQPHDYEVKNSRNRSGRRKSSSGRFKRWMRLLFLLMVLVVIAAGGYAWWWIRTPMNLEQDRVEFSVAPGASLSMAAREAVQNGVSEPPWMMSLYFRIRARGRTIKAGDYAVTTGMSPSDLLVKLLRGDRIMLTVKFIEGWTFKQARAALASAKGLKQETANMSGEEIMTALGRPGVAPEGRFFPDTFHYFRAGSDLDILRQSMHEMDDHLSAAWDMRTAGLPLKSPDEALTLASVVEKETGRPEDRTKIAGVFINRLEAKMPLQTDPTVIYGLGEAYTGRLHRVDLQTDTPFNTYMHQGLPPTPIALPGQASLMAAVQPAPTSALYFVSRGDGSSKFSDTLAEHNAAVKQYLAGQKK